MCLEGNYGAEGVDHTVFLVIIDKVDTSRSLIEIRAEVLEIEGVQFGGRRRGSLAERFLTWEGGVHIGVRDYMMAVVDTPS